MAPELRKHLASSAIEPRGPIRESPTPESGLSGKELVTKPAAQVAVLAWPESQVEVVGHGQ